jgi:PKHD-type hydroxylase
MQFWTFNNDQAERWAWKSQVFSPDECRWIIENFSQNLQPATVVGQVSSDGNTMVQATEEQIRLSNVNWIQPDDPNVNTRWIFERMTEAVNYMNDEFFRFDLTGFAEGFQFTQYTAPGGKYDLHVDKIHLGIPRKLSVVIQLSDPSEYEGGEFHLVDSSTPCVLPKEQGTLLCFPSYSLHGVTPVTKGTRYSMVGWITGPAFR